MNNSEQTSYQERLEVAGPALERLSPRLEILEKQQGDLLSILNSLPNVRKTISDIQRGAVITTKEFNQLDEFVKMNGLATKISRASEEQGRNDQDDQYRFDDMTTLMHLLSSYPYVVDADDVCDIHAHGLGGFIEIQKNGKVGLIRKGVDEIIYALAPDKYEGILSTDYKDFEKYGVLEIKNHIQKDDKLEKDYRDTTFLKIENLEDPVSRNIYPIGRFNLVTNFDKDNIAIARHDNCEIYYFVHKHFIDKDNTQIYRIGPSFASDNDTVKAGFDQYNSFAAEGRMIYKKRYDKDGKIDGIDVFKKSIIGKEVIVGNYETSK